jgi:hypothetical protein
MINDWNLSTQRIARVNSRNTKFLRQSVQVTGLGNTSFDRLSADIARIQALFKRAIGPFLQDEAAVSQFEEFTAIDASNRYFTPRTGNQEDGCPITADIDPKGYLMKAAGDSFMHTEENKVRYYEKHEGSAGEIR